MARVEGKPGPTSGTAASHHLTFVPRVPVHDSVGYSPQNRSWMLTRGGTLREPLPLIFSPPRCWAGYYRFGFFELSLDLRWRRCSSASYLLLPRWSE